jgi:hypothetical protein
MSKIYDINLDLPLIPGKGIGDIEIGIHIRELIPTIQKIEFSAIAVNAWPWRLYEYILYDSIVLGVDIFSGKLVSIKVQNEYRGKYANQIGIGSTIADLDTIREDLVIGENRIIVGEGEFTIVSDYDDDIPYIEAVFENRIVSMKVELFQWSWTV